MGRRTVLIALAGALALSGAVASQDKGYTPMGRRGYEWQTEMELAKEELRRFEVELAALTDEEWRDKSIAWLGFEIEPGARRIFLPASFHVGEVSAGKRAEVEVTSDPGELDPTWAIAYPKKAPRELKLVMTDQNETAVSCPVGEAVDKAASGQIGVFIYEGSVVCLFRPRAAG